MGGGRGPETLPANCAKGREWGRGDSEEWPTEHTEYTERGARGGSRGNGKWGGVYLTAKHTNDTKREAEEGGDDGKTKWGLRGRGG